MLLVPAKLLEQNVSANIPAAYDHSPPRTSTMQGGTTAQLVCSGRSPKRISDDASVSALNDCSSGSSEWLLDSCADESLIGLTREVHPLSAGSWTPLEVQILARTTLDKASYLLLHSCSGIRRSASWCASSFFVCFRQARWPNGCRGYANERVHPNAGSFRTLPIDAEFHKVEDNRERISRCGLHWPVCLAEACYPDSDLLL